MIFRVTKGLGFVLFLLIMTNGLLAQENQNGNFKSISIRALSGAHLYSGEGLVEKVSYGYGALDLRFAWQTSVDNQWAKDTGFASYGAGFYTASVGDPKIFGNPTAIYGFANFFLSNPNKRNAFEISPALGLTYHLEPYNAETNPLQDAIGSRMAVYFNVNFGAAFHLNRETDLLYGIDFTHYSNGRTFTPNYGLNLFGLNLGMRYHFNREQNKLDPDLYTTNVLPARYKRPERPSTEKNDFRQSIDLYAGIGTVQNYADQGTQIRYGTFSGVLDYRRYFNRMHGFTAGLDLFFDNSLAESYENVNDRYLLGIHGGYDLMFWKFDIRVQVGTYISNDRGKGGFFMRPALQYEISKGFFAQVGLKTKNGAAADWIEFGLGWKPFKW
jgi:hypothetical protein